MRDKRNIEIWATSHAAIKALAGFRECTIGSVVNQIIKAYKISPQVSDSERAFMESAEEEVRRGAVWRDWN